MHLTAHRRLGLNVQAAAELNKRRNRESKLHNRFKQTRRHQRRLKYYGHYLYLKQRLRAIKHFINDVHSGQKVPENWPVQIVDLLDHR